MSGLRWLSAVAAVMLLWEPLDVAAQGRRNNSNRDNGNGPAFCRSGAGHPVHGWEWCRQRGWDRAGIPSASGTAVRRNGQRQRDIYANRDPYGYGTGRQANDPAFDNGYADLDPL